MRGRQNDKDGGREREKKEQCYGVAITSHTAYRDHMLGVCIQEGFCVNDLGVILDNWFLLQNNVSAGPAVTSIKYIKALYSTRELCDGCVG